MDDSTAVRLRGLFPDGEVPAGAEQDHGDGRHIRRDVGSARRFELVVDVGARLGSGWSSCRVECVLVVDGSYAVFVYNQWDLWDSLVWIFLECFQESLGFC